MPKISAPIIIIKFRRRYYEMAPVQSLSRKLYKSNKYKNIWTRTSLRTAPKSIFFQQRSRPSCSFESSGADFIPARCQWYYADDLFLLPQERRRKYLSSNYSVGVWPSNQTAALGLCSRLRWRAFVFYTENGAEIKFSTKYSVASNQAAPFLARRRWYLCLRWRSLFTPWTAPNIRINVCIIIM